MFGKIAIRNIPSAIMQGLETLAGQHDRSTEAEARHAIRSWVEPLMQRTERSARCAEVSERLRELLDQVNKARRGSPLKPSHIAQAIREDHVTAAENWLTGQAEPSFKQLAAIAHFLGANISWLQHGDGAMFPVEYASIPETATQGVLWLLESANDERLTHVYFARENNEAGSLVVIKQYGDWHCKTYTTPYHVSEVIGVGGETALTHLSVMWHLLYRTYVKGGGPTIKSYLLSESGCSSLRAGNVHPLTVLREFGEERPWWEDFWDTTQFPKQDYWTGWKSVCARIRRVVDAKPLLKEEDELIRLGTHPFLVGSANLISA